MDYLLRIQKRNILSTKHFFLFLKWVKYILGNPVPEAKWVLRGRIVTNNTNSLYGTNKNIQYVIHEKGLNITTLYTVWIIPLGGFERWFNLTVVNISEEDEDDYTCVGVNAGSTCLLKMNTFDWFTYRRRLRAKCLPNFRSTKGKWIWNDLFSEAK